MHQLLAFLTISALASAKEIKPTEIIVNSEPYTVELISAKTDNPIYNVVSQKHGSASFSRKMVWTELRDWVIESEYANMDLKRAIDDADVTIVNKSKSIYLTKVEDPFSDQTSAGAKSFLKESVENSSSAPRDLVTSNLTAVSKLTPDIHFDLELDQCLKKIGRQKRLSTDLRKTK